MREFIELSLPRKVGFLPLGGYALAFHGAPRFAEDIKFKILVAPEDARHLTFVLEGSGDTGIDQADFLEADQVIQPGRAPNRIILLAGISGVLWEDESAARASVPSGDLERMAPGKVELIRNKQATSRPQDIADTARLRHS